MKKIFDWNPLHCFFLLLWWPKHFFSSPIRKQYLVSVCLSTAIRVDLRQGVQWHRHTHISINHARRAAASDFVFKNPKQIRIPLSLCAQHHVPFPPLYSPTHCCAVSSCPWAWVYEEFQNLSTPTRLQPTRLSQGQQQWWACSSSLYCFLQAWE